MEAEKARQELVKLRCMADVLQGTLEEEARRRAAAEDAAKKIELEKQREEERHAATVKRLKSEINKRKQWERRDGIEYDQCGKEAVDTLRRVAGARRERGRTREADEGQDSNCIKAPLRGVMASSPRGQSSSSRAGRDGGRRLFVETSPLDDCSEALGAINGTFL